MTAMAVGVLVAPQGAGAAPWSNLYDWPAGHGYLGWSSGTSTGGSGAYTLAAGLPGAPGLWIAPVGGDYAPGGAGWSYEAPGTTRISSARSRVIFPSRVMSHHCARISLLSGADVGASATDCKPMAPADGLTTMDLAVDDPAGTATTVRIELVVPCDKPHPAACTKHIPAAPADKNGLRVQRVELQLTDPEAPAVVATGPLRDLDGQYIAGQDTYDVRVSASDPGSGVAAIGLERSGAADVGEQAAPCDSGHHTDVLEARLCPDGFAADFRVDGSSLPEGRSEFRGRAQDVAGQVARTDAWSVIVDRTPPTDASEFEASFDPEENATYLDWLGGDDPALPDGTPGSGLAVERVRYIKPDGTPSEWLDTSDEVSVPGFVIGDSVTFEAYAIDRVGNESHLTRETVPVEMVSSSSDDYDTVFEPISLDGAYFTKRLAAPESALGGSTASTRRKCALSGIEPRITDRGGESDVNIYAFGNYGCPIGDWRFQYMRVEACLDVQKNNGDWQKLGSCAVDRRNSPQPPVFAIKNELCYPGTHDYRVRLHAKTALKYFRDPHVNHTLYASDLNCNEDGAWRVKATEGISSPSSLLGSRLRAADDDPPASRGFAAHHIVPASYPSRAAQAEEYAYACFIDPNSEINGVWLRGPDLRSDTDAYDRLSTAGKRRAYHPSIHTKKHFDYIADELGHAIGKNMSCDTSMARATLRSIKEELEYGIVRGGTPPDDDPIMSDD